jgi:hypothetical protein
MNEQAIMHQMLIQVERIVRPVRATQARKLRMRGELLAHLQSALEEEKARTSDDAAAMERAAHRLGNAHELTHQLQATVPLFERILFARIPPSERFERCEMKTARLLYGPAVVGGTLTHNSILLIFAVLLTGIPGYSAGFVSQLLNGARLAHVSMFFVTSLVGFYVLLLVCARFVFAMSEDRVNLRRALIFAALVLALQIIFLTSLAFAAADGTPSALEMFKSTGAALILLGVSYGVARWVAARRRPYDEWLMLDIGQPWPLANE